MGPDKVLVTVSGLIAIAFIVWFFWFVKKRGTKASSSQYETGRGGHYIRGAKEARIGE